MVEIKIDPVKPLKGRSYVYDLHYHLVFVTKYRCKAFTPEIQDALRSKFGEIARDNDFQIESCEVLENHVHLLVSAKPKYSVTVLIKKIKGISAKWLFQQFPKEMRTAFRHNKIWSHSYYVGSVGKTNHQTIMNYINSQEERDYK